MATTYKRVYETATPLRESMLWKMLEYYYSHCGPSAWNHIPFYPTSNPYIGEIYAEIILGVLLDTYTRLNKTEPIYIVEMATGTGTFSYYVLKELADKLNRFDHLKTLNWVYVMTDFTANNVYSWTNSPYLKPFIDQGHLDFGVYRPEVDQSIQLSLSGKTLSEGQVKNPMFAIANYFFDSIQQDIFQVDGDVFKEGTITLESELDITLFENVDTQAELLEHLEKKEQFIPTRLDYYDDPQLNAVLKDYANRFEKGSVLFPLGAINCVKNLLNISRNNLVLISSDKGFTEAQYMDGHFSHNITPHHGAFSFMVNYDAIGRYFETLGGEALLTEERYPVLVTGVFSLLKDFGILTPSLESGLNHTRYFFNQKLQRQNKLNDMYYSQTYVFTGDEKELGEKFNAYMSLLRLSLNDPIYFCGLADKVFETIMSLDDQQKRYLRESLVDVERNLYQIRFEHNALFWLGKTYYGLNDLDDAWRIFSWSVAHFGDKDCYSLYHLGAISEYNAQYQNALDYYQRAKVGLGDCNLTAEAIQRMQAKLMS
jgi:hypothetical protein